MADIITMPDGSRCEAQTEKPGLATCNCGSGIVPESVYVKKKFIGFHCRRCVHNYAKGK